jgi:hypothetical protein
MVIGGFTQGSSFVATLGFEAESLWDWYWEFPKGISGRRHSTAKTFAFVLPLSDNSS